MKITNDGADAREYPTLGVILQAGESVDDTTAKITAVKETPTPITTTRSASSDTSAEEVK
jgi:hypothetical protein